MYFDVILLSIFFRTVTWMDSSVHSAAKYVNRKEVFRVTLTQCINITETQIWEKCTIKTLLLQSKTYIYTLSRYILSSTCFSNEICDKKKQFMENINIFENFLQSINLAYNKLTTTNDGETYHLLFYSTVT